MGRGVVMLLGSFSAWRGGLARLAHQHADTVPIRDELHGELALPAHICQSVDNGTMSLSVPLGLCVVGRLRWQSWLGMQQKCAVLHPWIVLPAWLIAQASCSHVLRQANKLLGPPCATSHVDVQAQSRLSN